MTHTADLFLEMPVTESGHGVLTPVVAMRGTNEEIIAVRQISLFKDELQSVHQDLVGPLAQESQCLALYYTGTHRGCNLH